jgi:hypothetical protein
LAGEDDLIVDGKQVDRIFLPGEPLVVSQAEYRLENKASHARTCSIESCHFIENGAAAPLSVFHVYAGDRSLDDMVVIPPRSHLDLRVKFPFREVHVGVNSRYAVQLGLECDGRRYEAISALNIVQEKG